MKKKQKDRAGNESAFFPSPGGSCPMLNKESNRENVRLKLAKAREALEEVGALLNEGADLNFVMNSLYYAFLYPVLGLLQARNTPTPMQGTAIALFEREFAKSGEFDGHFLDAMRRAFELRPACACEGPKKVTKEDIEQLLPLPMSSWSVHSTQWNEAKRALLGKNSIDGLSAHGYTWPVELDLNLPQRKRRQCILREN
jgi:uncharacterized protein (UPF0332 family)